MGRLRTNLWAVLVVPICVANGCSDGDDDADRPVADASDEEQQLADTSSALSTPEPPVLTPCPEGWREVEATGPNDVATCDPWPATGHEDCVGDQAHFPGEPGCVTVGQPCPEGHWATDLPTDRTVLYVEAGAAAGGDGTSEAPFGTISDALAVAEAGSIIALGKGSYDESLELVEGVTIWGACVAETVIAPIEPWDPPEPSSLEGIDNVEAAITVVAADVVVRNLTVGGTRVGFAAQSPAEAEVRDVVVANATMAGVLVNGGSVTADSLVVRDTDSGGVTAGFALAVGNGASFELSRGALERNHLWAVLFSNYGTTVSLDRVAIRETQPLHIPFVDGAGMMVSADAEVAVRRAVIEENPGVALGVFDMEEARRPETALTLTDSVIRGSATAIDGVLPSGLWGRGELAHTGVSVERSLFERVRGTAVWADWDVTMQLTDVVIRDTTSYGEGDFVEQGGVGIWVQSGARAELTRVRVLNSRGVGVWGADEGEIVGTDVVVDQTREMECGDHCEGQSDAFGTGLVVRDSAFDLTRFLITNSVLAGVQLAEGGSGDLRQGEISHNEVGVNVQVPSFDLDRLQEEVVFIENGRNLDSASLPVPDPALFPTF